MTYKVGFELCNNINRVTVKNDQPLSFSIEGFDALFVALFPVFLPLFSFF